MTDWNQIVESFECHAKLFELEPIGNRALQNFSICVPLATGPLHHSKTVGKA